MVCLSLRAEVLRSLSLALSLSRSLSRARAREREGERERVRGGMPVSAARPTNPQQALAADSQVTLSLSPPLSASLRLSLTLAVCQTLRAATGAAPTPFWWPAPERDKAAANREGKRERASTAASSHHEAFAAGAPSLSPSLSLSLSVSHCLPLSLSLCLAQRSSTRRRICDSARSTFTGSTRRAR